MKVNETSSQLRTPEIHEFLFHPINSLLAIKISLTHINNLDKTLFDMKTMILISLVVTQLRLDRIKEHSRALNGQILNKHHQRMPHNQTSCFCDLRRWAIALNGEHYQSPHELLPYLRISSITTWLTVDFNRCRWYIAAASYWHPHINVNIKQVV